MSLYHDDDGDVELIFGDGPICDGDDFDGVGYGDDNDNDVL